MSQAAGPPFFAFLRVSVSPPLPFLISMMPRTSHLRVPVSPRLSPSRASETEPGGQATEQAGKCPSKTGDGAAGQIGWLVAFAFSLLLAFFIFFGGSWWQVKTRRKVGERETALGVRTIGRMSYLVGGKPNIRPAVRAAHIEVAHISILPCRGRLSTGRSRSPPRASLVQGYGDDCH